MKENIKRFRRLTVTQTRKHFMRLTDNLNSKQLRDKMSIAISKGLRELFTGFNINRPALSIMAATKRHDNSDKETRRVILSRQQIKRTLI